MSYINNPQLGTIKKGYPGNKQVNGRFSGEYSIGSAGFSDFVKWRFGNPQKKEKKNSVPDIKFEWLSELPSVDSLVWLGHATFVINIEGISMITDPVLYDIPMFRRRTLLPLGPEEITGLDYILLSHDHRDHLDIRSLKIIEKYNPDAEILAPLGIRRILENKISLKISEAGWFQRYETRGVDIDLLPAVHWGRRKLTDGNKDLWGSFMISANGRHIYFAGDTAYNKKLFEDIAELYQEPDICIFPIGAYSPRFFMKYAHMSPSEAVEAFTDIGGKTFVPMHYGTFVLSDEPINEPVSLLEKEFTGISDKQLNIPGIGEVIRL
ncbi:MAG: MBL fold metallo-hydrolase [Rikenellaceae bacterium]|nr:MBL fold metallo-hydrolase [Rikenellaceae bacterium]